MVTITYRTTLQSFRTLRGKNIPASALSICQKTIRWAKAKESMIGTKMLSLHKKQAIRFC